MKIYMKLRKINENDALMNRSEYGMIMDKRFLCYSVKYREVSAILDERNQIDNSSKKKLRGRLTSGTVALLIALLAVISATYAWYVYNTGRP
mgnify:CR=1 FL=1